MSVDIDCGPAATLEAGAIRRVTVDGREPLAVYNLGGAYHATDDNCSHKWASLAAGVLKGPYVVCPWHGGAFDVRTGRAAAPPCVKDLRSYPVELRDGRLMVRLAG